MAHQPSRSPIRLLAPAALLVCLLAFGFVVMRAGGGDEAGGPPAADTSTGPNSGKRTTNKPKAKPKAATYTVKAGDNLGSIAEKTGVPVERLRELNPELDPQALVSGQKIKLKE